jgi:hypothetical protein
LDIFYTHSITARTITKIIGQTSAKFMTQALRSVAPVASSDNEKADYDQLDDSVVSTCSQGGSAVQDSFMGGEEWTSTILEDLIRMERSGRLQPAGEYLSDAGANVVCNYR